MGVVAACAGLLVAAPVAEAATSKYAPNAQSRNFNGGVGGWTNSERAGGLCLIMGLTCPSITNSHQATGGNGGGFIRTSGNSLLGVISEAEGTWTSPSFRYRGADGDEAGSVDFTMDRRADVSTLVQAEGQATYRVDVVGGGGSRQIIDSTPLQGADNWESVSASVPVSELEIGDRYRIRITSEFVTPVTVVGQFADVDYDNVELIADTSGARGPRGPRGRAGGSGGGGKKLTCRGKTPSKKELRRLMTKGRNDNARARVKGSRLRLNVANKGKHKVRCRVQVIGQARLTGDGKATKSDRVRVKDGKSKQLRMVIRNRAETRLRASRRVRMRYRVKTEGKKVRVNNRVRLRRGGGGISL
jgi:hypothetical protein